MTLLASFQFFPWQNLNLDKLLIAPVMTPATKADKTDRSVVIDVHAVRGVEGMCWAQIGLRCITWYQARH